MEMTPQLIGLVMGVIVFCCTVLATFILLVVGGSFKRMREQVLVLQLYLFDPVESRSGGLAPEPLLFPLARTLQQYEHPKVCLIVSSVRDTASIRSNFREEHTIQLVLLVVVLSNLITCSVFLRYAM